MTSYHVIEAPKVTFPEMGIPNCSRVNKHAIHENDRPVELYVANEVSTLFFSFSSLFSTLLVQNLYFLDKTYGSKVIFGIDYDNGIKNTYIPFKPSSKIFKGT